MNIEMPWSNPSRQVQGRKSEKQMAKKHGARLHPNSGAGHIKSDASTADVLYEYKDALRSHTLKAAELLELFTRAVRQGKEAKYVIYFGDKFDLTATITLKRGKG